MSSVTNWRGAGASFRGYELPQPNALHIDRRFEAPALPPVCVEALSASWCVEGRPVVPGCRYSVPADAAAGLVARGKAKRVA